MQPINSSNFSIETIDLTKKFWQRKSFFKKVAVTALDKVSLQIKEGEAFGLLGPNGAGKTTLIKILCTLIFPDEGKARINGYDLREDRKIRASYGLIITEERSFYRGLTGRQNLEFFGTLHNLPRGELKKRIDELLYLLNLNKFADVWFQNYSTGMKQRLAIARGIIHNPKLIFMDEPTKGLDPIAAENLRYFVKTELSAKQGKTLFIATHQIQEAEEICGRIAIIDEGTIKACDSTKNIISSEGSLVNLFKKVVKNKPWNAV